MNSEDYVRIDNIVYEKEEVHSINDTKPGGMVNLNRFRLDGKSDIQN